MKTYILDGLKAYALTLPARFHMPGNKGAKEFAECFKDLAKLDITELSFSDNLLNPTGIIKQAQNSTAKILGAAHSLYLTGGSTLGVMAMTLAAKNFGKRIIVNKNAHQSLFNALKLFNIEPVFIEQDYVDGLYQPPTVSALQRALKVNKDIAGALLTYPDYYGQTFDIKAFSKVLKDSGKLLFIDGAHGGHLRFINSELYAGSYADAYVDGVHKTMPSLTQGAILNVNNEAVFDRIKEAVTLLNTTSPSYPIMASIEYAVCFMQENKDKIERVLRLKQEFISGCPVKIMNTSDEFKLILDFYSSGYSANYAEKVLESEGVYPELNDGRRIVFMLSVMTEKKDFEKLKNALKGALKAAEDITAYNGKTVRKLSYLKAVNSKSKSVDLIAAVNKIAAENLGVYPPCSPIITAGELITEDAVKFLTEKSGVFGINNGKVKVLG